jgi:uncharacterized short protein YbdD (DUF466 family)
MRHALHRSFVGCHIGIADYDKYLPCVRA